MPSVPLTSSWFRPLPDGFARIGISRSSPRWQSGYRVYRALAPGSYFKSVSAADYRQRYFAALARLDPETVLREIEELAGGRTPVLLCFEPPEPGEPWCHRAFVSAWLHDTLGLEVFEHGQEGEGCGWAHPKLPPELRRTSAGAALGSG